MNSCQLTMHAVLFEGEAWLGRSPRALTRVGLGLILQPRGVKSVSDFVDPAQYDMFPADSTDGPWVYQGAPLLRALN